MREKSSIDRNVYRARHQKLSVDGSIFFSFPFSFVLYRDRAEGLAILMSVGEAHGEQYVGLNQNSKGSNYKKDDRCKRWRYKVCRVVLFFYKLLSVA